MAVTRQNAWMLGLLSSMYMVGELGHFLIGVVSRAVAQDIHYGDQGCLVKPDMDGIKASFCENATTTESCEAIFAQNGTFVCEWEYTGLGIQYQYLAGPSYIIAFTIAGVFWGIAADWFNRVMLLCAGTAMFSSAIVCTAFANTYWQLVVLRAMLAVGEAVCSPLAAGMIFDVFPQKQRALAMSIFNWGIYIGYGLSYAIGNYITSANILGYGWRVCFVLSGAPGIIFATIFFFTVQDPEKHSKAEQETESQKYTISEGVDGIDLGIDRGYSSSPDENNVSTEGESYWTAWAKCLQPVLIVLTVAACIRHTAGFCWGYNSALYFQHYYPDYDAGWWLTCISIFGGSVGTLIGGYVSDRLVHRLGISARAFVLTGSQLLATPFMIGLLYLDPPYAFISLLIGYLSAEMWFGVMFTILVELVPQRLRSTAVGVALFIINNVGGNLPVLVAPISDALDLRSAIAILYPGALLASSVLFFVCCIMLRLKN